MSTRETNLLWLGDMLERLKNSHEQLQWAEDARAAHVLTEGMIRDLECCRKLCESLQRRSSLQPA